MTTTLAERIPLDEIDARAREVRPGRTVLTLIAGALFGAGWVAAKAFAVAWLALTWSWAAVGVGWQAGHGPSRAQQRAGLEAEILRLRAELSRFSG
jgi:hypothetical protein